MARTHIGRIKVIQDNEDIMDCICVCPHCGEHVLYGNMTMYSGNHGCPLCIGSLRAEVEYDRTHNYDLYTKKANTHVYEPYRYQPKDLAEECDGFREEIMEALGVPKQYRGN